MDADLAYEGVLSALREPPSLGVLSRLLRRFLLKDLETLGIKVGDDHLAHAIGEMRGYLERTFAADPPPTQVRAFYFGISETVLGKEESRWLRLVGSRDFDPEDPAWAFDDPLDYRPRDPAVPSSLIDAFVKIARTAPMVDREAVDYVIPLYLAATTVGAAIASSPEVTERIARRPVAVGFEAGDLVVLDLTSA